MGKLNVPDLETRVVDHGAGRTLQRLSNTLNAFRIENGAHVYSVQWYTERLNVRIDDLIDLVTVLHEGIKTLVKNSGEEQALLGKILASLKEGVYVWTPSKLGIPVPLEVLPVVPVPPPGPSS